MVGPVDSIRCIRRAGGELDCGTPLAGRVAAAQLRGRRTDCSGLHSVPRKYFPAEGDKSPPEQIRPTFAAGVAIGRDGPIATPIPRGYERQRYPTATTERGGLPPLREPVLIGCGATR